VAALLGVVNVVYAFDWTSTDIQFLHGSGYLYGSRNRDIITIEHSDGWRYGQNYFFVDTINHRNASDPVSWEAYGEFYSFLSAAKIFDAAMPFSWVKDLGVTLGVNAGSQPTVTPFFAGLAGGSVQFNVPYFKYFQMDFLAYQNQHINSPAFQVTPSWEVPFDISGFDFRFRGFMDYITSGGIGQASTIVFQPQLLSDLGSFWDYNNHVFAGVEYQFWHNKFGIRGADEHLPQMMVMYRF
jgi:hypothetical protein